MSLISKDKLFSVERIKAIWRISTGYYVNTSSIQNKYIDPSIFLPFSSSTEKVHLDDWDSDFLQENLIPVNETNSYKYFASNIKFLSSKPRVSDNIQILLDNEYTYEVYVNDKFITLIEKMASNNRGGGQFEYNFIALEDRILVKSIELRAIAVNYSNELSMNTIFGLKVNGIEDINEWKMPTGNYENHRYSWLDQINSKNANQLQVAWTFSTGTLYGTQGSPLVINDIMYVHTPFPNTVYALI